ncbi:MAG: DNA recombination protein RmuC [Alistipes sp.]|nr:DNA recombination protein RmuC [Alistipes sp.]
MGTYIVAAIVVVAVFVIGYTIGRRIQNEQLQQRVQALIVERDVLCSKAEDIKATYQQQMAQTKEYSERLVAELKEMNAKQVESQMAMIREQMQATSESVLKARQEELGERNLEQVAKIVDPINLSLKLMREALDSTKREHSDSMTRLDATIEANMRNSKELGETADRLTRALLGSVKVQGNFGELKLKQLLDDLGLEENSQYTTQQSLADRTGKSLRSADDRRMIPDFILHFPNNRDVIVDSKVSLQAYEQYVNAESEMEREIALKQHIASVRDHVRSLASKDYSKYLDTNYTKLNFVFMYMFNEGALNLALLNDTALWRDAYDMGVLIMGPQTMYMNLRVLELMWTQSRQLHYQEKIVKEAETMIERVQLFAERFEAVEESFADTLKRFESLKILTAERGSSIITSARHIISYGVKEEKRKRSLMTVYVEDEEESIIGELAENSESMRQILVSNEKK